ncbi:MAG TPA: hypothetical protein PK995_00390 [Bacteroidia bacterium]|nr:hypothetical protein [Bacteroidia bacterium]
MKKGLLITFIIFSLIKSFSQSDSTFVRKEGLYLNFDQFKKNQPISKSQIISKIDTSQLDFFTKVVMQKEIKIIDENQQEKIISPKDLWGYFQNGILYIYFDNAFYKVPVLGAISYFIGTQEVVYYTGMGMGVGYPYGVAGVPVKTREMKEFLLDYFTGKVYPFSIENLETLLQKDESIYNEFNSLSYRQKKKKYSYYIRKFNDKFKVE